MYHVTAPVVLSAPRYLRPTNDVTDTNVACIHAAVLNLKVFLNNESVWFQDVHVVVAHIRLLVCLWGEGVCHIVGGLFDRDIGFKCHDTR